MDQGTIQKLLSGDRAILARLITLAESRREDHQKDTQRILQEIIPHTGKSLRVGITGSPGVGKSTFIESLGATLTALNKRVAVLSIDPSSPTSKGSILGDKTRMEILSKDKNAFIRPTASQSFPGGVSHSTRESILLCEAAGFDVIIVETVGVGQSEFSVKDMTDCFVLLMLAGAGDELQGIKKGIVEMADIIVITKADGDNMKNAGRAQSEFQHALHLINKGSGEWTPSVITTSALEHKGIIECWSMVQKYIDFTQSNNTFLQNRKDQLLKWMDEQLIERLKRRLLGRAAFNKFWDEAANHVQANQWTVFKAVDYLLENAND